MPALDGEPGFPHLTRFAGLPGSCSLSLPKKVSKEKPPQARRVLSDVALRYSASQAGVQLALVNNKNEARAADSAPGLPLTRLRYSAAHMGCTKGGVADLEGVRCGGEALVRHTSPNPPTADATTNAFPSPF